jgi:hypothetical protein
MWQMHHNQRSPNIRRSVCKIFSSVTLNRYKVMLLPFVAFEWPPSSAPAACAQGTRGKKAKTGGGGKLRVFSENRGRPVALFFGRNIGRSRSRRFSLDCRRREGFKTNRKTNLTRQHPPRPMPERAAGTGRHGGRGGATAACLEHADIFFSPRAAPEKTKVKQAEAENNELKTNTELHPVVFAYLACAEIRSTVRPSDAPKHHKHQTNLRYWSVCAVRN